MHKPFQYIPPKPPMWFNLIWPGIFGAILGFLTATGQKDLMLIYAILGLSIFATLTYMCVKILKGSLKDSLKLKSKWKKIIQNKMFLFLKKKKL